MDKQHFIALLNKQMRGETTEEEDQFLISYYNLFEGDKDIDCVMDGAKKEETSKAIKENIWRNIAAEEQNQPKRTYRIGPVLKLAAAAVFVIICSTIIFYTSKSPAKADLVSLLNKEKENRLIHLQDGSTVILHVGARLTYPMSFKGLDKREVHLEGEAYFDISHNGAQPFIVKTGAIETTVMGTAFNVKAIPNDSDITVVVTRGKVKISEAHETLGLLTKGQQIIYNKSQGTSSKRLIPQEADLNWKRQDILLDDVTVEDAAKLLEDRFNVTISFAEQMIKANRFTTIFLKDETLEQVLESICEFNNATYRYSKRKASVIISKNSTQTN